MSSVTYAVPCHNDGAFLPEALDSICRDALVSELDITKTRIVVLNDGSTDNTPEVLEQYAEELPIELISVTSDKPSGEGGARTKLLRAVHETDADLYRAVDADDVLVPGSTRRMMNLLQAQGALAVSGHYELIGSYRSDRKMGFPLTDAEIRGQARRNVTLPTAYALFDGDAMRRAKLPTDMRHPIAADYELMMQILSEGSAANLGPEEPVVQYRKHADSITAQQMSRVLREFVRIDRENWHSEGLPDPTLADYVGIAKIFALGHSPQRLHPALVAMKRLVFGATPHV